MTDGVLFMPPKDRPPAKSNVGYEIPFTRNFYIHAPPRPLAEIRAEIEALEAEIQGMLGRVFE
jgi:type I restriction enzyme M protein